MGDSELREELRKYIEIGDDTLLRALHNTATSYFAQKDYERMIAEGEEDIKEGRVHTQEEVQKMIENWTRE